MAPLTQKLVHTFGALADLGQEITDGSDFGPMVLTSLHLLLGALAIRRGAIAEYNPVDGALKFVAMRGLEEGLPETIVIDDQARAALQSSALTTFESLADQRPELSELLERCQSLAPASDIQL